MSLPRVLLLSVLLCALSYALHAAEGATPTDPLGSPPAASPRPLAGPPVVVCREVRPLPRYAAEQSTLTLCMGACRTVRPLPVLTLCEIAGGTVSGAEGGRWGPL